MNVSKLVFRISVISHHKDALEADLVRLEPYTEVSIVLSIRSLKYRQRVENGYMSKAGI